MAQGKRHHHTYAFEKLEVWQLARNVRNELYRKSRQFPDDEKYGVTSQIRRSSNGITDNLAEGSGRASVADRAHFTNIAYSSALETINQLITCMDQGYINEEEYISFRMDMDEVMNKLNSYYRYQIKKGGSVKDRFE